MNKIVPIILFFVFAFIAQVFSSPTDTTVVYCDSVVLGNDTFYNDTVVSVPGEDAKEIMMHIIINHKVTLSISDTVCNSFTWNDSTYTSSGVYTQTFTASNGCDSIVTLNLTVIPPPDPPTVTDTSRCGAGALTLDVAITDPNWIVQWFADSTTVDVLATGLQYSTGSLAVSETPYLYYVQSVNDHYQNCNSKRVAITAMVNAIPERPMVTEYTNCGPGSFQLTPDNTNSCHWYLAPTSTSYTGTTPFATGYISESTSFFVSNVDTTNGCESGKVEFPVIIYPIPDTVDIYDVACKGNPYTEYGLDIVFSSEGEKHFVLPLLESFHGCDSVRILHVNVLLPQQYSFEDTACDIYTWNDSTYTSSGVYTQTFTASNGCDSIVTLNLTVKQSTSAIESLTLCSTQLPYSYNDTLLITAEGNYIFTIPNEAGCDSVVTLAVTVIPSPSEPVVSSVTRCGPGSVTLQASAGQNGTTCYWYSTEETTETIYTGTSYRFFLSDTTVLYVASVNEATGCVSTRVSDTAIVYNVPSSPNVADAARCGAGPVTMDVTVADTGWTVQWLANDTTAEVLATGVQYTTDTLPVSASPYVYYVQSADEHCPSHRVMVSVMVNPVPSEPTVSNATSCGPDTVTLQAIAGQNGTTCYWYSTEETTETIYTGTSYRFFLSDTTVLYVASVNEATGCVSTRVSDTAIVYNVPSSPNVADAARCGAGPVTMDVTVADTGWTVQWLANDTTAEVLATGVQYTTDTLPVSASPYVYYVQSADEHCPSHRVMVSVMVNPVPSEPTVSNATSCGPDTVTLQAIAGQNGTTCYWYSTEETTETIYTGTSYRFFLSDTTVLYVASVNEATGCVSTRVSDTAIVYNVPSSPNVADAARCGAGPVTMDVTVADTGWTVQWFANDTTAEVLAAGVQYTTDTLPVSTAPYMYYVQSADEHCQSSREMIIVTVNAIPEMYAIIGDTSVCRNQYVEYRYPVDDSENYRYVWYFFSDPDQDSTLEYNIPVWERYIEDSVSQVITVGMYVQDLQTNCMNDTSLTIHVSEEFSPDRTQIVRKNNSNILIYNNSSSLPSDIHYRWGYTDKLTFEETVVQDWIYNYYQYSFIDTIQFRYWVEAYVFYEDDTCRNRTYYLDEVVTIQDYFEDFDVIAFISGNQLQIQVDNPSGQHTVAVLYDMAGRTIAQWDLGIDSVIRKQISFGYPNGIYLLTVQVGNRRHTTKILNQQ